MSVTVCDQSCFASDQQGVFFFFLCTNNFKISNNLISDYSTNIKNENMRRSNRTELCDATRNRKQSRFETHLGSDATKALRKF